jgi:hypothetical protein
MRPCYRAFYRCLWLLCTLLFLAMCGQPPPLPANTEPIDGSLLITFKEQAGDISLQLRTEPDPFNSTRSLDVVLTKFSDRQIEIDIQGLHVSDMSRGIGAGEGTLRWNSNLGALDGTYNLRLSYRGQADNYSVEVSPTDVRLQARDSQDFTTPLHDRWLRLPVETVWFLASKDPAAHTYRTPRPVTDDQYSQTVDGFRQRLKTAGCTLITLERGAYTHIAFLAPWPDTWMENGTRTRISASDTGYTSGYQPIVEYYRCPGSAEQRNSLVGNHWFEPAIAITVHSWEKSPTRYLDYYS